MTLKKMLSIALVSGLLGFTSSALADGGITVDKEKGQVIVDAKVAPRKMPNLNEIYPIEVIACWGQEKKGEKAHETIVTIDIKPSDVHKALESLGLKAGKPARGEEGVAEGAALKIYLEVPSQSGGEPRRVPIEKTIVDKKTGKNPGFMHWVFTGSAMRQINPEKDEKSYGADQTGTLLAVFPVTDATVIQSALTMKDEPLLKMETDKKLLGPEGTPVKIIIEAVK